MKKKLLATLLTAAMVVSMAACGGNDTSSSDSGNSSAPEESKEETPADDSNAGEESSAEGGEQADASDIDTSEHVVITYLTIADKNPNTANEDILADLNAILTEKVNAELDVEYIGWTDYMTNYKLKLTESVSTGSVDLVSAADWMEEWALCKDGAFLELSEEMLQTYAPITWSEVTPEHWDMCRYNGNIMFIPEDQYTQRTNHGFIYRLDWAKKAGLENGVHSWDDMTTYFEWCKQEFPDMIPWDRNGGNSVAECQGGWIASYSDNPPYAASTCSILSTEDYRVVYDPMEYTEELIAYGEMMKKWDEIGVWRTDVLNNTTGDPRAQYRIGQSAVDQHHTQTWTDLVSPLPNNTIYQDDPEAETGFFWFGEEKGWLVNESIVHGTMAISSGSENPERALMVYDLLRNDPQCYRLINYGQEGRQYALDENGYKYQPDTYDKEKDDWGFSFWEGRVDALEVRDAGRDWDKIDAMYEEMAKVGVDNPYLTFVGDWDPVATQKSMCDEVNTRYQNVLSVGKFDGTAEEYIAKWQAELKQAGVQDIVDEMQRQVNEFYGVDLEPKQY